MKRIPLFLFSSVVSVFRMVTIGLVIILIVILTVDEAMSSKDGTDTIAKIVISFVFLPTFIPLWVEFYLAEKRKHARVLGREKDKLKYQKM